VEFHSATSGGVRVRGYNPTSSAATFALTTLEASAGLATNWNCGLCAVSSTSILAVWDRRDVSPKKGSIRWRTVSSVAALGTKTTVYNMYLQSKPYTYN